MKLYKYSLALILGLGTLSSCIDRLDLVNPNQHLMPMIWRRVLSLLTTIYVWKALMPV